MNDTATRFCLLAEADVLLLLAGLLPVRDATIVDDLDALAAAVDGLLPRDPGAPDLVRPLRRLAAAARALGWPRLQQEQARLFEGATPCPLDETAYVRRDKGPILADIAGFYRAFGLLPDRRRGEKLDNLATELEFLALLLVLEAQAVEQGRPQERAIVHDALRAFANDHTGAFLGSCGETLAGAAATPFHRQLAAVLQQAWTGFAAHHDLAAAAAVPAAAPDDCGSAFECGGCEGGADA